MKNAFSARQLQIGNSSLPVPPIVVGCMRISAKTATETSRFVHAALDCGLNYFDHADIYGGGKCEELFGEALAGDAAIQRDNLIIQSKCGIRKDRPTSFYDFSSAHILEAVDGSLKRLKLDYLDVLLLHRPDALMEPEEVAEAFDTLSSSGKVRAFGVSNQKPSQIELLKKYVRQPLIIDQLQFSIPVSNMIASGMEVNMETPGSVDHDGSILDYCRLNDMTIQAWSPFQMPAWKGPFIGAEEYRELNNVLCELAEQYRVTPTAIAAAWVLRHPARMQLVTGTASEERLREIKAAETICLSREEWYRLYLAAGHPLP